ncbi:MAG: TRZ/ATZ family hydrolase [Porticoccaceae bacterium]|nr:TRZ/ATZ family hydrolase [Porticoccaceae bacterium]
MNPEAVDLVINAKWIIPVIPENAVFTDCSVALRNGAIVAICPKAEAGRRFAAKTVLDLGNHALIPGLVNAHGHAAMTLFRGYADDLDLKSWLNDHIWPAETRWVSEEFVRDGAELAIAEMIKSGTTCFGDMYFFPDQVAEASRDLGMRSQVAFPIINFATAWARDGDDYIHKGLALRDSFKGNDLVTIAFGPHAPYTVEDRLFEKVVTYANELDAAIQVHLHETLSEVEDAVRTAGKKPLQRLFDMGLLSPNTQCVHMVALDDEDIELVAASKAHVIHCPKSNMKLGNGSCPVTRLMDSGVNVALGTDGAASNNSLDMFAEMQFASLLAKGAASDPTALDVHQTLRMATINGARALGMEKKIGSIEPGKSADLVAVDLSGIHQQPLHNPLSQLIYTQSGSNVSHVWVAGKALLNNGEFTHINEQALIARAQHWHNNLAK